MSCLRRAALICAWLGGGDRWPGTAVPSTPKPTHSDVDGQEITLKPEGLEAWIRVHVAAPPSGLVDVRMFELLSATAQRKRDGQEMDQSKGLKKNPLAMWASFHA